jgi:hypothetical protein
VLMRKDKLADLLATTLKDLPKGQFEVMWDSQNYEFCQIYQEAQTADRRRHVDPAERDSRPQRTCPLPPALRHRPARCRSEPAHDRRAVDADRHRLLVGRCGNPPQQELHEGVHQPARIPAYRTHVGLGGTDRGARLADADFGDRQAVSRTAFRTTSTSSTTAAPRAASTARPSATRAAPPAPSSPASTPRPNRSGVTTPTSTRRWTTACFAGSARPFAARASARHRWRSSPAPTRWVRPSSCTRTTTS